jgi:putative ABC transport system permease protein
VHTLTLLHGAALLLAGVGLFGVVSHGVGRRTRELAIRAALGAAGGLGLGRSLQSLLFEVSPSDPASLGVAILATLGLAAGAAWLAGWRAGRASPAAALQAE